MQSQRLGTDTSTLLHIINNENILGDALKDIEDQGVNREDLFLSTKLWNTDYAHPGKALEASLKKLNQEYVDLYYIHWPFNALDKSGKFERNPMYKVWAGLEECVEQGLVMNIGVWNFNVQSICDMLTYANIKPACCQVELHPHSPQHELVRFLKENEIVPVAHTPISAPNRGKLIKVWGTIFEDETLKEIAEKHNKTIPQIALAWNMARGVVVIPKSQDFDRAKENFESQEIELDEDDIQKINDIKTRVRVYNPAEWQHMNNIPIFD